MAFFWQRGLVCGAFRVDCKHKDKGVLTMTMAEYLRSARTTTQAQADKVARVHDAHWLTEAERAAILKGSK